MRTLTFCVSSEYDGTLLKRYLRGFCGLSARRMASLKRVPGGICLNGKHVTVIERVKTGDLVSVTMPDDKKLPVPKEASLCVVYEDCDLLVVNKQAGLPMYARPGLDCGLCNVVGSYSQGEGYAFRPVYRIDKDTTGLVVLAKNAYVAASLAGKIQKQYFAVCEGKMQGQGCINSPIRVCPGSKVRRETAPDGKRAVTHWEAVASGETATLIRCRLETGRTHQIRVHMASCGHPLAGDEFYGGSRQKIQRQALHCGYAWFCHPVTGKPVELFCPFPLDLRRLMQEDNMTAFRGAQEDLQKILAEMPDKTGDSD